MSGPRSRTSERSDSSEWTCHLRITTAGASAYTSSTSSCPCYPSYTKFIGKKFFYCLWYYCTNSIAQLSLSPFRNIQDKTTSIFPMQEMTIWWSIIKIVLNVNYRYKLYKLINTVPTLWKFWNVIVHIQLQIMFLSFDQMSRWLRIIFGIDGVKYKV